MTLVLRSGSATDRGKVRSTNQDSLLDQEGLYAVADGMGGHAGGEVASRTAIDAISSEFSQAGEHSASGLLARSIQAANRAVWDRAGKERSLRGMGTTLVGLAAVKDGEGDRVVIANVGDSRAYLLKNRNLVQITTDHTVVEQKLAAQELTAEEAAHHPHRHILTRALGTEPNVEIDAWQLRPVPGDRFLLCSDGLFNEVSNEELAAVLQRTAEPTQAANQLVELARAHGGSDNITVVVVDVVSVDGTGSPEPGPQGDPAKSPEPGPQGDPAKSPEPGPQGDPARAAPKPAEPPPNPASGLAGGALGSAGGLAGGALGSAGGLAGGALGSAGGAFGAAMMGIRTGGAAVPDIPAGMPTAPGPSAAIPKPDNLSGSKLDQGGERAADVEVPPEGKADDPAGTGSREKADGPGQASALQSPPTSPRPLPSLNLSAEGSMSSVMADVLRAADSPDWPGLTGSVPRSPGAGQLPGDEAIDPMRLDQLFAASERAHALRDTEDREALRDAIRHNEGAPIGRHRFPHFVSSRRNNAEMVNSGVGDDTLVRRPLVTWRVIGFCFILFVILAGAFGSVAWFAQNSYFVGIDHGELAVYQGRPGGLAWFQPHLVEHTAISTTHVLSSRLSAVRAGVIESSRSAAIAYIHNLVAEARFAAQGGATAASSP